MFKAIAAWLTLACAVSTGFLSARSDAAEPAAFESAVAALATSNFKEKEKGVIALGQIHHPNTRAVLAAMLGGNLYYRRDDKHVFVVEATDAALALIEPSTMKPEGAGDPADFSKITTNNQLRKVLKSTLAGFDLTNPDASVRLAALLNKVLDQAQ